MHLRLICVCMAVVLTAVCHGWTLEEESDKRCLPIYEAYLGVINAQDMKDVMARIRDAKVASPRQQEFFFLLCSECGKRRLSGRLPWEGAASVDGCDFRLRSERIAWALASVFNLSIKDLRVKEMNESPSSPDENVWTPFFAEMKKRRMQSLEVRGKHFSDHSREMSRRERLDWVGAECPPKAWSLLSADVDREVRLRVARSSYVPVRELMVLREDPDAEISRAARQNLIRARTTSSPLLPFEMLSSRVVLSRSTNDLLRVREIVASHFRSAPDAALSWLASQLDDLRLAMACGELQSAEGHDLSLVGGKCAWLLERILGVKLASVTKATPQDVLTSQKKRVEALVRERYGEKPSSP